MKMATKVEPFRARAATTTKSDRDAGKKHSNTWLKMHNKSDALHSRCDERFTNHWFKNRDEKIKETSNTHSHVEPVVTKLNKLNFFGDDQVRQSGSIFQHRTQKQYHQLVDLLPPEKINGIHIKLEDDCPQGGDDVRICVLKAFGAQNRRVASCSLCANQYPVFDRYPLFDGTFYISPIRRSNMGIKIKFENAAGFLESICAHCMMDHVRCSKCKDSSWFLGKFLIIGTLYMFDILSTKICCPPTCQACKSPVLLDDEVKRMEMQKGNYGRFAEYFKCPSCSFHDYHYIRKQAQIERYTPSL